MNFLGRFYPGVIIDSKDKQSLIRQKHELRESKFNFTKKANANYKKALFIEEHHKHKEL
jgi:hypothetical protein